MLEERAHFATIWTMTIAHREEMTMLQAHYMWISHVGILVDLVRVVSWDTAFSGEWELCDDVDNLWLLTILWCLIFLLWSCAVKRLWIVARVLFAWRLWASSYIFLVFRLISQFVIWAASSTRRDNICSWLRLSWCIVVRIFWSLSALTLTSSWWAIILLNFRCNLLRFLSLVLLLLFNSQATRSWTFRNHHWLLLYTL